MRPWFRLRRQVRLHLREKGLSARQAKPVAQLQAVDELLFDPAHTIDSLAVRDGKSERSIRMTLSLAFLSPVLAEAAMEGRLPRGFCVKRLTARRESSLSSSEGAQPLLRPLHLVVRETEFCGLRLAGEFRRRTRENSGNSVRRPRHASLTDKNCEGFCRPGNRGGLPGLHGGGRSPCKLVCDNGIPC